MIVAFEPQTELLVVHPQVSVPPASDRLGHYLLYFLRHDPNVGLVATVVTEAIKAKTVVKMAEQDDVVFEPYVRSSSATASTHASASVSASASMHAGSTHAATAKARAPRSPVPGGRVMPRTALSPCTWPFARTAMGDARPVGWAMTLA